MADITEVKRVPIAPANICTAEAAGHEDLASAMSLEYRHWTAVSSARERTKMDTKEETVMGNLAVFLP